MRLVRYLEAVVVEANRALHYISLPDDRTTQDEAIDKLSTFFVNQGIYHELCEGPPTNGVYFGGGPRCFVFDLSTDAFEELVAALESVPGDFSVGVGLLKLEEAKKFAKIDRTQL